LSTSRDFWLSCGHHLLDRDAAGKLLVTDEFLKAYLARPELMPPPEACAAEQSLHGALLSDPRRSIAASQVAAIADADARENWEIMIAWRDHLVKHRTLEAAYLEIVRRDIRFPHVLMGHLMQPILRNMLEGCEDAFMLRAAEIFFRPQKLVMQEGSITALDEEADPSAGHHHPPSPLFALLGLPATTHVDPVTDESAASYWERSDRFDMAIDLTAGGRGCAALGKVITRWLAHLLAIDVVIEPLTELQAAPWSWYVGLSADATRIGDALWDGDALDDATQARVIGLYRLTFRDPAETIERVRGEPVYLLVAMTPDEKLRLKPQNLVTGLPVRLAEAVH
jgi:hypothetical protein